jgi:hypothetical protein
MPTDSATDASAARRHSPFRSAQGKDDRRVEADPQYAQGRTDGYRRCDYGQVHKVGHLGLLCPSLRPFSYAFCSLFFVLWS